MRISARNYFQIKNIKIKIKIKIKEKSKGRFKNDKRNFL